MENDAGTAVAREAKAAKGRKLVSFILAVGILSEKRSY